MPAHPLLEYLELERPLAFVDAASTGLDTRTARIVRLTVLKIDTDGNEQARTVLVNPRVPIPPGATEVHGIADEDVTDAPVFAAYAKGLAEHLEGCDLAGFGVERFDAPLLVEEFKRCGVEFSLEGRAVVDAMAIFHRLEPRDLAAAYRKFAGVSCRHRLMKKRLRGLLRRSSPGSWRPTAICRGRRVDLPGGRRVWMSARSMRREGSCGRLTTRRWSISASTAAGGCQRWRLGSRTTWSG